MGSIKAGALRRSSRRCLDELNTSPRELLILDPLRLHRVRPQPADLVGLVLLEVAFEPLDMGLALEEITRAQPARFRGLGVTPAAPRSTS